MILFALDCPAADAIDDKVQQKYQSVYDSCIRPEVARAALSVYNEMSDHRTMPPSYYQQLKLRVHAAEEKARKAPHPRCKAEADKAATEIRAEEKEKQECPLRPAPVIGMLISDVLKTNWGKIFDRDVIETRLGTRVTCKPLRWFCPNAGDALVFENGVLEMIMR